MWKSEKEKLARSNGKSVCARCPKSDATAATADTDAEDEDEDEVEDEDADAPAPKRAEAVQKKKAPRATRRPYAMVGGTRYCEGCYISELDLGKKIVEFYDSTIY